MYSLFSTKWGGLITLTWKVPVGIHDLDQHIVLESIIGPYSSDLISIDTFVDDSTTTTNPHLNDPLELELSWLNLDGSTPYYTFVPFSGFYLMAEPKT